jgi:capsular exopolysaccharide synthesis family protein
MSRIQHVLEKAERDGARYRVRGIPEPAPAVIPVVSPGEAPANGLDAPANVPLDPFSWSETPASDRVITDAQLNRRLLAAASNSTVGEQYRALRTRVLHADHGSAVNVVLVTSAARGDGRSLTAANLSLAMAQEYQRRVCVVDADLRNPEQHRLFGIGESPGLSEVLTSQAPLEEALVSIEPHRVTILPAGRVPAHPAELLGTAMMRRVLETLRSRFDCVILDAPPATPLADVSILTPLVGGVLMVVRAGVTSKPAIHDAIGAIEASKLLGLVLNDAA